MVEPQDIDLIYCSSENPLELGQLKKAFPFVKNFYEIDKIEDSFNFVATLVDKFSELSPYFILLTENNLKSTYSIDKFLLNDEIFYERKIIPRRFRDLSKSSWTTKKIESKREQNFFNSRDFIYKKYGVNCRFTLKNEQVQIYSIKLINELKNLIKSDVTYSKELFYFYDIAMKFSK